MRADAIEQGAKYVRDEVTGIDIAAGRAAAVRTMSGDRICADNVVIAAGPASGRIAALAEIALPVEPRKRTVFVIRAPLDGAAMPLVFDTSGMWIRPEGDTFLCGISPPSEADPHPGDDFDPDLNLLDDPLWPLLAHRIPALEQLRLQRAWAGHYDQCLLDHNAVIGPLPGIPNLFRGLWLFRARRPAWTGHRPRPGRADTLRRIPDTGPFTPGLSARRE